MTAKDPVFCENGVFVYGAIPSGQLWAVGGRYKKIWTRQKTLENLVTIFDSSCIESLFSKKPFLKVYILTTVLWMSQATYSLWNGTFGWWNTNVDVPFLDIMEVTFLILPY